MINYSQIEKQVFELINKIRENPGLPITELEEMLQKFDGKEYKITGTNTRIITEEGQDAVLDAIEFLKN